ncbi:MAG: hypothetical protein RLZZ234_500 [Candidatus Parcubacteria bacterium]
MGISASHWGALCENADHEARMRFPNDSKAQRRYVEERLGIIGEQRLEDMRNEASASMQSLENHHTRTTQGALWKRLWWKSYYFFAR